MEKIASQIPIISFSMCHLFQSVSNRCPSGCFLCLLSGAAELTIGNTTHRLEKDAVIYLAPEATHSLTPEESALLLYVQFHPCFLSAHLSADFEHITYISCDHGKKDETRVATHLANITAACLQGDECLILSKVYDFFHYFAANHLPSNAPDPENKAAQKLFSYQKYMEASFRSSISLTDAAAFLGYTPQYLSSFLKKNLNLTFQEHLTQLRLRFAELLVRFSLESDSRISALCGFPNTAAFTKAFETAFGQSTKVYRSSHPTDSSCAPEDAFVPVTRHSLILDYLYNYLHHTVKSGPTQEQIPLQQETVLLQHASPMKKSWNQAINLGPITAFDKPSFRYTLKTMQQQLHFSYGRCVGLIQAVGIQTLNGRIIYDFSRLFDVIDFMQSIDMLPFFELGNKPFDLYAADETTAPDYATFLDLDAYDAVFFQAFPIFIREAINRYGFDRFCTWKFEFWRSYNPGMTSVEPPSAYCSRFQRTAEILKSLAPNASLGGPGFNAFLQDSRFTEILDAFRNAKYQPDFFSVYCFPSVAKDPNADLAGYFFATELDYIKKRITALKKCIKNYHLEHIPLYITEYSAHLSNRSYLNDSNYPAAFILQQFVDNYDLVDVMAYWLASDLPLSGSGYSYPFFGGSGLYSRNIVPKTSYYAFEFLSRLGCNYVTSGDHYLITQSDNNSFQVLCFYPVNLKRNFRPDEVNREILHFPYSTFEHTTPLDLNLNLVGFQPGTYLIREMSVGLKYGNVLEAWGTLNHWKDLTAEDIKYIQAKSVPYVYLRAEQIADEYLLQTRLDPNEAKLYLFEYHV